LVRLDEPVGVRNGNAEYYPRGQARGVFVGEKSTSTATLHMFKNPKAAEPFLRSLKEDSTNRVALSQLYHLSTARAKTLTENQTDEGKKRAALCQREYVAKRKQIDPDGEAAKERAHWQRSGEQRKERCAVDEEYRMKLLKKDADRQFTKRLTQRQKNVNLIEDLRKLNLDLHQVLLELESRAAPRLTKGELVGKVAQLTALDTKFEMHPVDHIEANVAGQTTLKPLNSVSLHQLCHMTGRVYIFGTVHEPFSTAWYAEAQNRVRSDKRLATKNAFVLDLAMTENCADSLESGGVEDHIQRFMLENRGKNTVVLHGDTYSPGMGNGKKPTEVEDYLAEIKADADARGFELEGNWESVYYWKFRAVFQGYVGAIFIPETNLQKLPVLPSRAKKNNGKDRPGKVKYNRHRR